MSLKLAWISFLANLAALSFFAVGQECDFTSSNGMVEYRISAAEVNYTEALAQGTLLYIEDAVTQDLVSDQMSACNVSTVWLGVRQIAAESQAGDAKPWAWIPECCNSSCLSAESLQISYQGCFDESLITNSLRDLPYASGLATGEVSVTSCIQECASQSYKYAGVHVDNGHHCYCGNTFGRYGSADRCGLPCPGNSSQSCGYYGQNAVYLTRDTNQWASWAQDQPNNFGGYQYCVFMQERSDYLLADESCHLQLKYICETAGDDSTCSNLMGFSNDTASNAGSCYYISETTASWYTAMQTCRANGRRLLYISSSSEHEFVKSWLANLTVSGLDRIWVGLYRNTFVTSDGSSSLCYTNFADGEPGATENSYVFLSSDSSYKWQTTADTSLLAATITQTVVITTVEETTSPEITTMEMTTTPATSTVSDQTTTNPTSTYIDTTIVTPTPRANTDAHSTSDTNNGGTSSDSASGTIASTAPSISTRLVPSTNATTSIIPAGGSTSTSADEVSKTTSLSTGMTSLSTVIGPTDEPNVGASTGNNGLSPGVIAAIVVACVLFLVLLILFIAFLIYTKHKSTPKAVSPYDVRHKASIPVTGPLGFQDIKSMDPSLEQGHFNEGMANGGSQTKLVDDDRQGTNLTTRSINSVNLHSFRGTTAHHSPRKHYKNSSTSKRGSGALTNSYGNALNY